jgi:hypothetical protein
LERCTKSRGDGFGGEMKTIILTKEILNAGKSSNGSWGQAQLEVLGAFPLTRGWQRRVIGSEFTADQIKDFLSLQDVHLKLKPFGMTKQAQQVFNAASSSPQSVSDSPATSNTERATIAEAKRRLYHALLCVPPESWTENEIDLGFSLVKDPDIQQVLERALGASR